MGRDGGGIQVTILTDWKDLYRKYSGFNYPYQPFSNHGRLFVSNAPSMTHA